MFASVTVPSNRRRRSCHAGLMAVSFDRSCREKSDGYVIHDINRTFEKGDHRYGRRNLPPWDAFFSGSAVMRSLSKSVFSVPILVVSCLTISILAQLSIVAAQKVGFTRHDLAYYLEPSAVVFVRPGLAMQIQSAGIGSDGAITVQFSIQDAQGLPLDLNGIYTPGPVAVTFVAGYIPRGKSMYVSYTTQSFGPPVTATAGDLPGMDAAGTFKKLSDGQYQYTFATHVPTTFDPTVTHTIGAFASRDLREFGLGTQYVDAACNFVPNGTTVTVVRDVIRTASCNKCHGTLAYHDGARRNVALCVVCHTSDNKDLNTGESLDFRSIIHKMHAGSELASVQAGGTFVMSIENFADSRDYSVYEPVADIRNCQACHDAGPAQADAWLNNPSRAACGSCHDLVNFVTGENHANLAEPDDSQCATCHIAKGQADFDISIIGAHAIPNLSPSLPGAVAQLVRIDNAGAGKQPTVTFTLKDNAGNPIPIAQMDRLNLTIAGPTSDYSGWFNEDATGAQADPNGTLSYTFKQPLPTNAKGTFTVAIEGSRPITLQPGTKSETVAYDFIRNQMQNFSVDGSPVKARRTIISTDKCYSCHVASGPAGIPSQSVGLKCLSCHPDTPHAGNRNRFDYCSLCHNPNETDTAQRPPDQMPAESLDFMTVAHKIHTGENREWRTIYGTGSLEDSYDTVRYPQSTTACDGCHVNGSEELPLPDGLLPVQAPANLIPVMGRTTAACLSCHEDISAAAHAYVNTSAQLGEACVTCHGKNAEFSVSRVHAQ